MKARPRSVEREVAKHLTEMSARIGLSPVERIPVLGRTGPDITTNELGLVIDVKSRLSVPQSFLGGGLTLYPHQLVSLPLDMLLDLPAAAAQWNLVWASSVVVKRWFDHMDEWTRENLPSGISSLVLHRPKMPIGKATLIIHQSKVEELSCKLHK